MMHWQEIEWEQGGARRSEEAEEGAAGKFNFSIKSSRLIGLFIAPQLHNFQSCHRHQHSLTMSKRTNAVLKANRIFKDHEVSQAVLNTGVRLSSQGVRTTRICEQNL